jgi:hypothetical protein
MAKLKYKIQGAPRLGWSVAEWCDLMGISRGTFYNRQKDKTGPRILKLGGRSIITPEAHEAFRLRHEEGGDAA